MRKSLLLWVVIFALLSTFVIGCGGGDDDDDDDSSGPVTSNMADFADTWYALAIRNIGETTVQGYLMDMMVLTIIEDAGQYAYTITFGESGSDVGTCEWDAREDGDYIVFTSTVGEPGQIKVSSFDDDRCLTVWYGENGALNEIVMVRSPGIYGIVTNGTTDIPFVNATIDLSFQGATVATAQTDAWGIYSFTSGLTDGNTYYMTASVDGFTDGNIAAVSDEAYPVYAHLYLMEQGAETGTVSGQITDSETGMAPNVNVNVSTDDGVSLISSDGTYVLNDVQNGTRTITATAEGYLTYTGTAIVNGETTVHDIALTPENAGPGPLATISMEWSSTSTADFDLLVLTPHILGRQFVIDYENTGDLNIPPYAQHQGDATTGSESPEEIIFSQVASGTYVVYATRFGGTEFRQNGLIASFKDANGTEILSQDADWTVNYGEFWIIAEIVEGTIVPVNELTDVDPYASENTLGDVKLLWSETAGISMDLNIITPAINGQTYTINYNNPGSFDGPPFMQHQGDDYGVNFEENVLVNEWMDGIYSIYVLTAVNGSNPYSGSQAKVRIYNQAGTSFQEASSEYVTGAGNYWYVGDVNGATNQFTIINRLQYEAPTSAKPYVTYEDVKRK